MGSKEKYARLSKFILNQSIGQKKNENFNLFYLCVFLFFFRFILDFSVVIEISQKWVLKRSIQEPIEDQDQ